MRYLALPAALLLALSMTPAAEAKGGRVSAASKPMPAAKGRTTVVAVGVKAKDEKDKAEAEAAPSYRRPYVPPPKFDPPPKVEFVSHGVPVPVLGRAPARPDAPGFQPVN